MTGTFGWAMIQLRDGHKIHRKSWQCKTTYYYLVKSKVINEDGDEINITDHFRESLLADDWEVWEPILKFKDLVPGDKFQWDFDYENNFSRWTYQVIKGDKQLLTVDTSVEDSMYELTKVNPNWANKRVYKVDGKVMKDV